MAKVTLLDCTQFLGKEGGNAYAGTGCIRGCTKCEIWKPTDTYAHDVSGVVMAHQEAPFGDKQAVRLALLTNERIAAQAKHQRPGVRVPWYAPEAPRGDFAGMVEGNRQAAMALKQAQERNADLITAGFPGRGLDGVFIDLYDFFSIRKYWAARAAAAVAPWVKAGVPVIPILCLRWLDSGIAYTPAEATERIGVAAGLSTTGEVAIFDGRKMNGEIEEYRTWSLRGLVESMVRGI